MRIYTETASEALIRLLQRLMEEPLLKDFYLVGGTALALKFGHRKSIDLDLFTQYPFDAEQLRQSLSSKFQLQGATTAANTILGQINQIKTDFIAHQYPLIREQETISGIRMLSTEDLAAMKLNAIANRRSKKDFWDYAMLLEHFNREELLHFYEQKYPESSVWNVEKSLSYFEDAEQDPAPVDLSGKSWEQVKNIIQETNRI